ncbi:MAG: multidrug efflux SMR transporter [Anaerolineaceae bacterium]|nr:multidrug efflux SMR transporter [Anaerolineaceae bacterium]
MHPILLLMIAILTEVIATTALKISQSFTRLVPSIVVVVGYGISFYLFSLGIKYIPLGVAYAIWSGVGTAGTIIISIFLLREKMDVPMIIGTLLIILGVIVIGLFSKSVTA